MLVPLEKPSKDVSFAMGLKNKNLREAEALLDSGSDLLEKAAEKFNAAYGKILVFSKFDSPMTTSDNQALVKLAKEYSDIVSRYAKTNKIRNIFMLLGDCDSAWEEHESFR